MKKWQYTMVLALLIAAGCSSSSEMPTEEIEEQSGEKEETEPVFNENDEQAEEDSEQEEQERAVEPPATNEEGELTEPGAILALVNREFLLPGDYVPEDLTVPDVKFPYEEDVPKKQLREPAAKSLEALFKAAEEEGLSLYAISGYRSYQRQQSIFAANVEEDGEEEANKYSARPGESEHQTGLAMDVSSPANDFDLTNEFGETPEGKWLQENAHRFGFIIRYPEGKTEITGYQYEPWHLRYVGEEAAYAMYQEGSTLEEYYGLSN